MKKFYAILIIVVGIISTTNAQWNWYNPKPMGEAVYDIKFIDNNTGFACGSTGHIVKTVNGGNNWYSLGSINPDFILALSFIDADTGWAFGYNTTIYKTTDGGTAWTEVSHNITGQKFTAGLYFNEDKAILGCESGIIYLTTNGGTTWTQVSSNTNAIRDIFFYDNNLGFAACSGGIILKTTNGGLNWSAYDTEDPYYFTSVFFTSENTGYVCGFQSFFKTSNGGLTWTRLQVSEEEMFEYNFEDCYFTDDNTGYLVTDQGQVFSTINGGLSWNMSIPDDDKMISAIDITANGKIFVGNMSGKIFKSEDNSESWTCMTSSYTNQFINSIAFINSEDGIAVGNQGVLMKTYNGGCAWDVLNWGTNINLTDIIYLTDEKIIVSTSAGTVYISENEGDNWTSYTVMSNFSIKKMYFVNDTTGWAVGYSGTGTVCKTTDGGYSWTQQTINSESYLTGVVFTSLQAGYITSSNKIFATSDGGVNWNTVYVGAAGENWQDVDYVNSDTVFVCGSNSKIAKSYDAGATWTTVALSGSEPWLEDIELFEDGSGYCVGAGGIAFQTSDFGATWEAMDKFTNTNLAKIIRNENTQLFAVGYNGAILSNRLDIRNMITYIEQERDKISSSIYPNPANENISIGTDILQFSMIDLRGRLVKSGNTINIDVSDLNDGIYFIQYVKPNMEQKTEKIIISH